MKGEDFVFERQGSRFVARGDGWSFEGVGSRRLFTQTKKLPSIRVVKTLVKELLKA